MLISAAVKKYANDNGVDFESIEGSGKEGRILKKDVTAVIEAREPEVSDDDLEEDDPLADLDFGDEEQEPAVTKEDVRKAMVALQSAARDRYIANGEEVSDAKKKALDATRKFLKKISGSDTLGGIDESKYADIVAQANSRLATISK